MLKKLSNFFMKNSSDDNVAPKPEWLSTDTQDVEDSLSMQAAESIQGLKCFLADGKLMVALFGSSSELSDGWLRNCAWDQVFCSYPNLLPLEQRLSLQEAQRLAPLVDSFTVDADLGDEFLGDNNPEESEAGSESSSQAKIKATAFRDWVQEVSDASEVEAKAVKSVANALFSEIQQRIDAGDSFRIGGLKFRTRPFKEHNKNSGFFSSVIRS